MSYLTDSRRIRYRHCSTSENYIRHCPGIVYASDNTVSYTHLELTKREFIESDTVKTLINRLKTSTASPKPKSASNPNC